MPYQYIQIWNILRKKIFSKVKFVALTRKKNFFTNFYLKFLNIKINYIEDYLSQEFKIEKKTLNLKNEEEFYNYKFNDVEIGKIALSTFFRSRCQGEIIINEENKQKLFSLIYYLEKTYKDLCKYLEINKFEFIFITEIFVEEYSLIANIAIKKNINLVRFNFTAKDDYMIINKINNQNYRTHHASINKKTFEKIKQYNKEKIEKKIYENFNLRYSDKWSLSSRNQINSKDLKKEEIFEILQIKKNKKVGVIFSHILYDLIYAYGNDIYLNYFSWLGNTLQIVSKLKNVNWLLKVHPANTWRSELNNQLKSKFEEIRVLDKFVSIHDKSSIKIIPHDTPISPLSLMNISDLCITVRGTAALEMAVMGKRNLCAGTGRYDSFNFSNTYRTHEEYKKALENFNNGSLSENLNEIEIENAKLFYYGLFICKPIRLPFIKTHNQFKIKKALSMDHFNYLYDEKVFKNCEKLKKYVLENDNNSEFLDDDSFAEI